MPDHNPFVVNRLRQKPISYTVRIDHFVSGGEWMMGVSVHDVEGDIENRQRIAADLREAAALIENSDNEIVESKG